MYPLVIFRLDAKAAVQAGGVGGRLDLRQIGVVRASGSTSRNQLTRAPKHAVCVKIGTKARMFALCVNLNEQEPGEKSLREVMAIDFEEQMYTLSCDPLTWDRSGELAPIRINDQESA